MGRSDKGGLSKRILDVPVDDDDVVVDDRSKLSRLN